MHVNVPISRDFQRFKNNVSSCPCNDPSWESDETIYHIDTHIYIYMLDVNICKIYIQNINKILKTSNKHRHTPTNIEVVTMILTCNFLLSVPGVASIARNSLTVSRW